MKIIIFILVFLLNFHALIAQEEKIIRYDSISKSETYVTVDKKPEFPGGLDSLNNFYKKNSSYPLCTKSERSCKAVYYQIFIDSLGNINKFNIIKGANAILNKEVERLVQLMPKWKPGMKNGLPVDVLSTQVIKFKEQNDN